MHPIDVSIVLSINFSIYLRASVSIYLSIFLYVSIFHFISSSSSLPLYYISINLRLSILYTFPALPQFEPRTPKYLIILNCNWVANRPTARNVKYLTLLSVWDKAFRLWKEDDLLRVPGESGLESDWSPIQCATWPKAFRKWNQRRRRQMLLRLIN